MIDFFQARAYLAKHYDIGITDQCVTHITNYLATADPGAVDLLGHEHILFGESHCRHLLDAIGFMIVGRNWPGKHESEKVQGGFMRRLASRCKPYGITLGHAWDRHIFLGERIVRENRIVL